MEDLDLESRTGLPEALRILRDTCPREGWSAHPGFDGLVSFWMERHLMFRRLLTMMTDETAALLDRNADPRAYGARLSRLGGTFVNELHAHHRIEDMHYFPQLARRAPEIARGFALLEGDHVALDRHLGGFVAAANAVLRTDPAGAGVHEAAGRLATTLLASTRLLDRHLTDEEDLVVPVILRFGAEGLA